MFCRTLNGLSALISGGKTCNPTRNRKRWGYCFGSILKFIGHFDYATTLDFRQRIMEINRGRAFKKLMTNRLFLPIVMLSSSNRVGNKRKANIDPIMNHDFVLLVAQQKHHVAWGKL